MSPLCSGDPERQRPCFRGSSGRKVRPGLAQEKKPSHPGLLHGNRWFKKPLIPAGADERDTLGPTRMRKFPHKMKASLLERKLQFCTQAFAGFVGPERQAALNEKRWEFFFGHMRSGVQTARLRYLFDAPLSEVIAILRRPLPDLLQGSQFGGHLNPVSLSEYLGVALAVRDAKTTAWLAGLSRTSWKGPDGKYPELALLISETMQAGARRDKIVFARLAVALRKAWPQLDTVRDPEESKALYEPKLAILESLAAHDPARLEKAWISQAQYWASQFPRPSDAADMDAFLDVETLGYARLARTFGLQVPDTNPYAPVALLDEAERHP